MASQTPSSTGWISSSEAKVGDLATIVTPNGKRELEILKLKTIHDEAAEAEKANGTESNGAAGVTN